MQISDFYNDTVTVPVEHRGRKFSVEAYPERSTSELGEEANAIAGAETVGHGECHIIKTVVKSWTLNDEFSQESLLRMSQGLRRAIISAVGQEAAFPTTAASAGGSSATSAQAANSEESRSGTDSPTE